MMSPGHSLWLFPQFYWKTLWRTIQEMKVCSSSTVDIEQIAAAVAAGDREWALHEAVLGNEHVLAEAI